MIKVKILKAQSPTYWYAKHIGQEVKVKPYDDEAYEAIDLDGMLLRKTDVQEVVHPSYEVCIRCNGEGYITIYKPLVDVGLEPFSYTDICHDCYGKKHIHSNTRYPYGG